MITVQFRAKTSLAVQFLERVSEMATKPHFFLFPTEHKGHLASTLVLHPRENNVGSEIIARPFLDKLSDRSINVYEKDQN